MTSKYEKLLEWLILQMKLEVKTMQEFNYYKDERLREHSRVHLDTLREVYEDIVLMEIEEQNENK